MSHDYHEGHPGYNPAQVLCDGCDECGYRSRAPEVAIGHLDPGAFARAWSRAADFERGRVADISEAEVPVLRVLWAMQCQFERLGIPIGALPAGVLS